MHSDEVAMSAFEETRRSLLFSLGALAMSQAVPEAAVEPQTGPRGSGTQSDRR